MRGVVRVGGLHDKELLSPVSDVVEVHPLMQRPVMAGVMLEGDMRGRQHPGGGVERVGL